MRNLVCSCLARLYASGDLLPLFSRVNALQTYLQDKSSAAAPEVRGVDASSEQCMSRSRGSSVAIGRAGLNAASPQQQPHQQQLRYAACVYALCCCHAGLQVVRLAVLELLGHLSRNLGRFLASSTIESMAVAAK